MTTGEKRGVTSGETDSIPLDSCRGVSVLGVKVERLTWRFGVASVGVERNLGNGWKVREKLRS